MVWRQPSSLNQAVQDPYCQSAPKNDWSYGIEKHHLLSLLQTVFFLPSGVQLVSVLPRLHEKSRAHIVDFLFSNNIVKRLRANDFRRLLGFSKLRSTRFSVEESWNRVVFSGRGFGHGVGLCQWGAQRWARQGKGFRSILKHYYPQAHLKKLDPESMQAQRAF
jgi:stage II sporulation protein D